jgi:GMC oxidoreductase
VEIFYQGKPLSIVAGIEVVLSLGAIHTPKVLMQSGIGDEAEWLDSVSPSCSTSRASVRTFKTMSLSIVSGMHFRPVTTCRRRSSSGRQAELPMSTAENAARFGLPAAGWTSSALTLLSLRLGGERNFLK